MNAKEAAQLGILRRNLMLLMGGHDAIIGLLADDTNIQSSLQPKSRLK